MRRRCLRASLALAPVDRLASLDRLAAPGRVLFALGLGALGVAQFVTGTVVAGRAPEWPAAVPGGVAWAYAVGALLVATAAAALARTSFGRPLALASAAVLFVWAFLRQVPLAAADPTVGAVWTFAGKALAFSAGALALAATLPRLPARGTLGAAVNAHDSLLVAGRVGLGLFMVLSGVQHFLYTEFVATLVPAWIPGAVPWTYAAGVFLVAGGLGLLLPPTVRLAGALSGLMFGLWVVLLHVPRALADLGGPQANEWVAVAEAVACCGLALILAGTAGQVPTLTHAAPDAAMLRPNLP